MEATKTNAEALDRFDMANLRPKSTRLPMTIWVSERGRANSIQRYRKWYM
jgi:hypothetical protein